MSQVVPKRNVKDFIPIVTGMPSRVNSVVSVVDQNNELIGIRGIEIDNVFSVLRWITYYNSAFLKLHPAL